MNTVLLSTVVLSFLGLFAGTAIAIASKVFSVNIDPKIEKIEGLLPGANCGGCGNPSCFTYAEKIVNDDHEPNLCVFSTDDTIKEIGGVLGIDLEAKTKAVAAINCSGGMDAAKTYEYTGMSSCIVASLYGMGDKHCKRSCLGFGDCIKMCKFGAISHNSRGIPTVDREKCTGCGMCAMICPKNLITLIPIDARPFIACDTRDKGKFVIKNCSAGCISCKKCVKVCPNQAITMRYDTVVIDYSKCDKCGLCIENCPRKIIKDLSN